MSLVLPNNLSGGKFIAKERKRTSDARGNPVLGLGRQATIEEVPEEEHRAADPQTKPHDVQKARYRVYQTDDPMLEPDEYGAELTKDARVWKVYVKEADRWDAELVDGWKKDARVWKVYVKEADRWDAEIVDSLNKQAFSYSAHTALFSAVSTTFLIESSGMLKQDPNDVSAAALVVISQALVALAGNSSADPSMLSLPDQSAAPFMPPHNAVVVNTLWYLSLATSIATSFLAMLAKDWCHSFTLGRSGHPWMQAQRRQRKWMMIERWKMQELIVVLGTPVEASSASTAQVDDDRAMEDARADCGAAAITDSSITVTVCNWTVFVRVGPEHHRCDSSYMHSWSGISVLRVVRHYSQHGGALPLYNNLFYTTAIQGSIVVLGSFMFIPFLSAIVACLPLAAIDTLLGRRFWESGSYWHRANNEFEYWYLDTAYFLVVGSFFGTIKNLSPIWIVDTSKLLVDMLFKPQNHDYTVSYSLHWLIKFCETPSSVAIALQAIAGATCKIQKGPLEECESLKKILKRLVSSPSGPKAAQEASLYARALQFLVSSSSSDVQQNGSSSGKKQDVAVMIWDLKLQNEEELMGVLSDGTFAATDQNMEALRIGSSAPSHSLRVLQGKDQDARATLDRIGTLLFDSHELHPAAFRSLINGIKLLASCSSISWSWVDSVRQRSHSYRSTEVNRGPKNNVDSVLDELLVTLFQAVMVQRSFQGTQSSESRSAIELSAYTYLRQALGPHALNSDSDGSIQAKLCWVRCYEMVSNLSHYKLDPESSKVASVKAWCNDYLIASDPVCASETSAFVAAISRVYETVAPQGTKRKCLPEAVYVILVFAASLPRSKEQFAACTDVLSKFSFPSLSTELVHATQLWLLLHLVGDSATDTQKRLNQLLKDEEDLEIKDKGFDQVKKDLETRILHYYKADRLDTYSARIIECIHESSGIQPDKHTKAIMDQKLKDVPQSHRGLKQLIGDRTTHPASDPALITTLPPSIPSSRVPSVMPEPEPITHEAEERWNVDHLSIKIVPSPPAQDENRVCPDV
ncbi:unnamed protein product [Rhizoctonia solani]|uniref:DUF6535 domain-containing protein n=1 Tax=Rhizoctonia solani TaxID=456999 RepID=A0A8H3B001_9AGAM|nr:unnamed protein product [Rhizoctonia solani]